MTEIEYDPYSYEIDENPYPIWARMRREAPLYRNEKFDFYALSRFEDVHNASLDWRSFSSSRGTVLEILDVPPDLIPQFMIFMDPPRHERLRKIVNRGFTPRHVNGLEERIRQLARQYLEQFSPGDSFDFVQDFGAKLPMMVIGSLVGIPEEDQDQVRLWSDEGLHVEEGETVAENFKHLQDDGQSSSRAGGMTEYLRRYIELRRQDPQDDLISSIMTASVDDGDGVIRPLTEQEILDFIGLLTGAGNETVARLLGWAGWLLPRHPEQLALLGRDPSAIPAAVEELLRYEPPSPVQARVVTQPVEVHGTTLEAGSKVLLLTGSAGRDEAEYRNPDAFDITRNAPRHLSFGYGIHFCLGASLARLEARIALEELVRRFPSWTVDEDAAERVHTSTVRGYLRLPVQV